MSSSIQSPIKESLSLQEALRIGLRENLMLRAAQTDIRAAVADTLAARSMTRLQVSANTYLTYGDASNIFGSFPGVGPANLFAVPARGFADQNITLMLPLSTGGRLNSLIRSAKERERAVASDAVSVQLDIALQIKEAYYRALLASELVKAAEARLEAGRALLENTRSQVEAGKAIEASALRVEAEVAEAQRILTSAKNEYGKILLDLKAVMGVKLEAVFTLSDTLTLAALPGDLTSYLKDAATNRPELKAARNRTLSAEAQIGAAKGAFQPQIYGAVMADAFTSSGGSTGTYSLGVVLSFPLSDGGQRRADAERAKAMKERSEAERREIELRVAKEARQAWLDIETATQNYQTAQSALKATQSAYEVIALRVQNQKAILVEQLDALATLTQARGNLAQALYDHALAVARLQRAVGKT